jgi:hypothetical protein
LNGEVKVSPDRSPSAGSSPGDGPGPADDPSPAGGPDRAGQPARGGWGIKLVREISLALAIYGMAGWIYVSICALAAPQTLALPLTHLLPGLREDTSGVLSFLLSFFAFIAYRLTGGDIPRRPTRRD